MQTYIAQTLFGLEEVQEKELLSLGAQNTQILNRAVEFSADKETLYKIHLWSGLTLRVLQPFASFEASNEDELYREAMRVNWQKHMDVEDTFKIDVLLFSSIFKNSMYVGLKVKDALCDSFRKTHNKRPNVDVKKPNFTFSVHIRDKKVEIFKDCTGDSLHMRKYRVDGNLAPLNEVLAAGIIALTGWQPGTPLLDGMTGSGTLVVEALFKANQKPPASERRNFAFMHWPDFDEKLWNKIRQEAEKGIINDYPDITGIEVDGRAFNTAKENLVRAGFKPIHHLQQGDFFKHIPKQKNGVLLLNPPYDVRIKTDNIPELYEKIGDHLKHHFQGWTVWIISANEEGRKHIGLKTSQKIKLFNGKLECRLMKFEINEWKKEQE
jgi:putative N6-adenine-specific DNA methylase